MLSMGNIKVPTTGWQLRVALHRAFCSGSRWTLALALVWGFTSQPPGKVFLFLQRRWPVCRGPDLLWFDPQFLLFYFLGISSQSSSNPSTFSFKFLALIFHITKFFLVYLIVPFVFSCILSLFQEGNISSYIYGYLQFFLNKISSVSFKSLQPITFLQFAYLFFFK